MKPWTTYHNYYVGGISTLPVIILCVTNEQCNLFSKAKKSVLSSNKWQGKLLLILLLISEERVTVEYAKQYFQYSAIYYSNYYID